MGALPQLPSSMIAPFDGPKLMAQIKNANGKTGASHNLALRWLGFMLNEFRGDASKPAAGARMKELTGFAREAVGRGEAALGKVPAGGDPKALLAAMDGLEKQVAGPFKLKPGRAPGFPLSPFNPGLLLATVTHPKGGDAMIYSFWYPPAAPGAQGGAHSIAFFHRMPNPKVKPGPADKLVSFFDANFGEGCVDEGKLGPWFDGLRKLYSGAPFHMHCLKYFMP